MRRALFFPLLLALVFGCDPGSDGDSIARDGGGDGFVLTDLTDSDGDTIPDEYEGRSSRTDTDGDGTPDYLDDDSDGDGIPDSVEAGDDELETPPANSDGTGAPDFQDTDADDNGIPDSEESTGDADGDGKPDFADPDDDNDRARDVLELASGGPNLDSDGDGLVDFKDPDRDDDTIRDGEEGNIDTDEDGLADWDDLDSDADGWSDAEEAGDTDVFTDAVDTDGDGTPDFQDPDSDNDGISDAQERVEGTDRVLSDTDGDGVSDLIEVGAGTDPLDGGDSPRTRGDFVFVIPYEEPPEPARDTLEFSTALQLVDVYFAFDITTSMNAEMDAMRSASTGVPAIVAELECGPGEDPVTTGCIPDLWTGTGSFHEIDTYKNLLSLQDNPMTTASNIPTTGPGAAEAPFQPPACVADGSNCNTSGGVGCTSGAGRVGCPGFREDAVRIYMQITDADDQCSGARCSMFNAAFAGSELRAQNIGFIGLYGSGDEGGAGTARSVAEAIANAAGSVDSSGSPFVFPAQDAAVVPQAVAAVKALAQSEFRVTIEAAEEPDDDGDALRFVDFLEINGSGGACTPVSPTEDTDLAPWGVDGHDDAFPRLVPGTSVCWDVVPIMNDIQEPALTPLVYKARLTVRANGSPVDSRLIFFLIPPRIEVGPPIG